MAHWRSRTARQHRTRYIAALFAPDGEYVIDPASAGDTIEDVDDFLANMGSRWVFYPFPVIIRDRDIIHDASRIVNAPLWPSVLVDAAEGRTLRTFGRFLASNQELIEAVLLP